MLQPLSTLPLSKAAILELGKSTCLYVQDLQNAQGQNDGHSSGRLLTVKNDCHLLCADSVNKHRGRLLEQVPATISALDLWQEELRRDQLPTLCRALDRILDGGFQCRQITEICGSHGSGKSQICMQMSIVTQLAKECGGLNSRCLYIDTRNGFSPIRVRDMIEGCRRRFPNTPLDTKEILRGINVVSPRSSDDLLSVIRSLKRRLSDDSKIRVVIVDSLSLPVQCSLVDPWQRTQFYFRISEDLQKIAARNNVAIIVVNELCSYVDSKGEMVYANVGGQMVAHRANKRLVVARLNDFTFAARILKAPTMPQTSVIFSITEDGIREGKSR